MQSDNSNSENNLVNPIYKKIAIGAASVGITLGTIFTIDNIINSPQFQSRNVKIGKMEFTVKPFEKGYMIETIQDSTILRAIDADGDGGVDVSINQRQGSLEQVMEFYNFFGPDGQKDKYQDVPKEVQYSFDKVMEEYYKTGF